MEKEIKGLVWDDEPEKYMELLKEHLSYRGIALVIKDDKNEFSRAAVEGSWDFVILDLIEQATGEEIGSQLAREVAESKRLHPWFPIFVLTKDPIGSTASLPRTAVVRHKDLPSAIAAYIEEELKRRGVIFNKKKVFQIFSFGDHRAQQKSFEDQLRIWKRIPDRISGENLKTEILNGLIERMNGCGAIVAICTADDQQVDGTYQPRQNVLLEIGIALGLARGLEKLVILQQWGVDDNLRAKLPTDLGGVVTIRFTRSISEAFEAVDRRFGELGMV